MSIAALSKTRMRIFRMVFFTHVIILIHTQQPVQAQYYNPLHTLNISPKAGGKAFTLFNKTKVSMQLTNGNEVKGRIRGVSKDSVSIDYISYAIKDLDELRFNPGTALGVVAAIATTAGLAGVALTADGGEDKVQSDSEEIIFWSGLGLAVAGGIILIPTYFVKKKFTREEYDFTSVMMSGY